MLVNAMIQLASIYHQDPPEILLKVNDTIIHTGKLLNDSTFKYSNDLEMGNHNITLELLNKTDNDTVGDKDKAVIINSISFFGICSKQIMYDSKYVPAYSAVYLQTLLNENNIPDRVLTGCNYLGWNGVWTLTFNVPVFKWLHQKENLGWIYPS